MTISSEAFAVLLLVLACLGIALGAASNIIHLIAPRTKTQLDDKAAKVIDDLRADVASLAEALRSVIVPQPPTGGTSPVTAVVTTTTITPDQPAVSRTSSKSSVGSPGAPVLALLLAISVIVALSMLSACTPGARDTLKSGLWQCTAPERAQAVDALTPLATSAILAAASADGKLIDTSKLEAALSKANLESDAGALAMCAAATAIAALLHPAAVAPGAPAAAGLVIDPSAARAAFDAVRAQHAPGVTFHTSQGDV